MSPFILSKNIGRTENMELFTFTYKNPKSGRLLQVLITARNYADALRETKKEIVNKNKKYFLYGG